MKILHTSDWHFGRSMTGAKIEEDQSFFLSELYETVKNEGVSAVIIAGDVYDSAVSNADAINMYNEAMTTLCAKLGQKVIVIAGNHDSAPRLSSCSELLKAAGLYVSGRVVKNPEPISLCDNVDVYSIPFFNRDEIIALFPDEKDNIRNQEDASKVYFDHLRSTMDSLKKNIVVSHAYIVNAELSDSDRAAQVGQATAVSKDVFEGFDYVALGHIHKPQVISDRIRYSGAPVKTSFGAEESQQKLVYIYDTDTDAVTEIPIKQKHEWRTITTTFDEIMTAENLDDTYLRIRLTDRPAGADTFAVLKERFPLMLSVTGQSFPGSEEETHFSRDDFEKMGDEDILKYFLAEKWSFTADDDLLELFRQAAAECED